VFVLARCDSAPDAVVLGVRRADITDADTQVPYLAVVAGRGLIGGTAESQHLLLSSHFRGQLQLFRNYQDTIDPNLAGVGNRCCLAWRLLGAVHDRNGMPAVVGDVNCRGLEFVFVCPVHKAESVLILDPHTELL
jgi:hypothetical protein